MHHNPASFCFVIPLPPPYGGIANWSLLLKERLDKEKNIKFRIINIAPKARKTEGRGLWSRVVAGGLAMLKARGQLKKILKEGKTEVIHIATSGQLALVRDILLLRLARRMRTPTVYHIHFGRIPEMSEKGTIEWRLMLRALKLSTAVITINQSTYQTLHACLPDKYIEDIPNLLNIDALPAPIPSVEKRVMYLGWIIREKGIEELLEAWNSVFLRYPDWRLNLIGPGSGAYIDYLREKYSMDGIEFLGEKRHEDAMELLNHAEVFVLPSHSEGFPNVILEAMALSKAVIASDAGAIPEMLSDGCGIVIPRKSTEELTETLLELLGDRQKRLQLGHKAREKVKREYDTAVIYKKYQAIWKKAAEIGME